MLSTKLLVGLAAALTVIFLGSCQQKVTGPPPRYAVLRFENLSGDASLDWAGRAVSEDLSRRLDGAMDGVLLTTAAVGRVNAGLGGRPVVAPGISGERAAAAGAGANRAITGYLLKSGSGFRLVASVEDLGTHKIVRLVSAPGKSLLEAIGTAATELAVKPRPGLTANEAALHGYAHALETSFGEQGPLLENALAADPKLGPAWAALVRVKARQDRAGALATADRGIEQKLEPVDTAALEIEKADLQGDRKARLVALRRYVGLNPGDLLLLRGLAEQETAAGEFAAAAADWQKVLRLQPGDVTAMNQAGYNHAWAGNYAEAAKALKDYAQLAPQDSNPLDSLGDVNYWFKRYAEAAANYSAAHDKDPKRLNGGDLYKAAWARLRAGDKKAADELMAQFVKLREADRAVQVLQADWLYQTGRGKEAEALLREKGAASNDAAQKVLIFSELAVWDMVAGKREAALADLQSAGQVATPATVTIRFAAQRPASAAEWETRADRWFAAPQMAPLRNSALAWALMLDGKKEAALKVWEKYAADRPATDFFARDVLTRLKGQEIRTPAAPDPRDVNQFAAVLASL